MEKTKEDILKEIETLKDREFERNMKDRWSDTDYEYSKKNNERIASLTKELEEMP